MGADVKAEVSDAVLKARPRLVPVDGGAEEWEAVAVAEEAGEAMSWAAAATDVEARAAVVLDGTTTGVGVTEEATE